MTAPLRLMFALILGASVATVGCRKDGDAAGATPKTTFISIGTGSQTGVYYPTGQTIADFVNRKSDTYRINASVESTGGSLFNINALLAGDMDFGIAQSDVQWQAYNGKGEWLDKGPRETLRAVFSIHPELVTLVAADDSGIRTLQDLKGKKVNLDSPGSGTIQNALVILRAVGLDPDTDLHAERLSAKEAPGLLQDGRIDAFFFTAAHPNGALVEASAGTRDIRFVPIAGPEIDEIMIRSPYLTQANIPLDFYPGVANTETVSTIGLKATLVTTDAVSEDVVYALTKEVFENLPAFKKLHESRSQLTREDMLDGLSAPLHAGAERYYREVGLID